MKQNKTEGNLAVLFDFQRFVQNQRLAKLIADQETDNELSDEALGLVNAAGDGSGCCKHADDGGEHL